MNIIIKKITCNLLMIMRKLNVKLTVILVFLFVSAAYSQLIPNLGGQRVGTSSLQFLKIGMGARATGMGEAFVAVSDDISSLFWNPAGLVQFEEDGFTFSHTQWFVDTRIEYFGGVYHFLGKNAIGLSITSLRTEDMKVTTEFQPTGTGEYFRYSDLAIGLSFAKQLTEQFSFGVTVKYIEESLGKLKMRGVVADLATFYRTGLGTSRFAVIISNFGSQVSPTGSVTRIDGSEFNSFQKFSPPTLFRIGFAIEPWMNEKNRITTSVQLNSPNDNAENVCFGVEYAYNDFLFLRTGYKLNVDAENISFGAGIKLPVSIAVTNLDYSFANFRQLGIAHRLSLNLTFGKK